jgi:hypothetical protein
MTLAIITIAIVLMCFTIFIVTKSIAHAAYEEGREVGYRHGIYDASKQQVETDKFMRGIESASKTSFPHRG